MVELTQGEDPQVLPMLTREDERGAVRLNVRHTHSAAHQRAAQRALPSESSSSAARHKRQRLQYPHRCRRARSDAVMRAVYDGGEFWLSA